MKRKLFSFSVLGMLAISSFGFALKENKGDFKEIQAADYYASITDGMTGTTLKNALNNIIDTSNVSVSYDWSRYEDADEDPNNSNNVIMIYARTSVPKTAHVSGSTGWNREHTFPQSKMGNSKSKSDNHIVYASDSKVNGARGNLRMGYVSSSEGSAVIDSYGRSTTCLKTSNLFDPHNLSRGIVARTTMYAAVMYDFDPVENFESVATMLEWHLANSVTSNDVRRNNVVYGNQHNRNPFVDHPEYACKIWGNTNSSTQSICSQYSGKSVTIKTSDGKTGDQNIIVGESLSFDGYVDSVKEASVSWSLVTSSDAAYEGDALSISVSGGVATVSATKLGEAYLKASYTYDKDGTSKTVTAKIKLTAKNPVVLDSIAVKDPKTEYAVGESFVKPKVIATYTDSSTVDVTSSASFSGFDSATAGEKTITVTYQTKETSYTINVIEAPTKTLTYISVTAPDKLDYYVGESLDKGGMKVFAKFSDGTNVNITKEAKLSFEGPFTEVGTKTIVVSYTFNDITKEDTFDVTVKEKPIDPPSGGGSGNGCGGNVATTSVILASFALAGIITIVISSVIRKKKNKA